MLLFMTNTTTWEMDPIKRQAQYLADSIEQHRFVRLILSLVESMIAAHRAGNEAHAADLAKLIIAGLNHHSVGHTFLDRTIGASIAYAHARDDVHPSHAEETKAAYETKKRARVIDHTFAVSECRGFLRDIESSYPGHAFAA